MLKADLRAAQRRRRFSVLLIVSVLILITLAARTTPAIDWSEATAPPSTISERIDDGSYTLAIEALGKLAVRERADGSSYDRDKFSSNWGTEDGCDMRNRILQRDLSGVVLDEDNCTVLSGTLEKDQFSGKRIDFERGTDTSHAIHIEHIVAVSDAWQKGAQYLSEQERYDFYHDPLNLIAVDGPTNLEKGNQDASRWMPRERYRCRYVARQIAVKERYQLWITPAEHAAMKRQLNTCPLQVLPIQGG